MPNITIFEVWQSLKQTVTPKVLVVYIYVFYQGILLLFRNDFHLSAIDCTVGVQLYWLKQIPEVPKNILTLIFMGSENI